MQIKDLHLNMHRTMWRIAFPHLFSSTVLNRVICPCSLPILTARRSASNSPGRLDSDKHSSNTDSCAPAAMDRRRLAVLSSFPTKRRVERRAEARVETLSSSASCKSSPPTHREHRMSIYVLKKRQMSHLNYNLKVFVYKCSVTS